MGFGLSTGPSTINWLGLGLVTHFLPTVLLVYHPSIIRGQLLSTWYNPTANPFDIGLGPAHSELTCNHRYPASPVIPWIPVAMHVSLPGPIPTRVGHVQASQQDSYPASSNNDQKASNASSSSLTSSFSARVTGGSSAGRLWTLTKASAIATWDPVGNASSPITLPLHPSTR